MLRPTTARARLAALLVSALLGGCGSLLSPMPAGAPRSLFSLEGTQTWNASTGPVLPYDPSTVTLRPEEVGAPMVMLLVRMVATHTFGEPTASRGLTETTHFDLTRVAYVVDEAGVERARVMEVLPPGASLTLFEARTHTADGRQIDVAEPPLIRIGQARGAPAAHVFSFGFPEVTPGSIIVWRYRMAVPSTLSFDRFELQEAVPVRRADYILRTYRVFDITTEARGMRRAIREGAHGQVTYDFSAVNLPDARSEPLTPPGARISAAFVIRKAFGQPVIADWASALRGFDEVAQGVRGSIRRLPTLTEPAPQRGDDRLALAAARVHALLREQVVAPPPSDNSFAADVNRRRTGDLGRAYGMAALLDAWGERCDLVFTTPAGRPPISADLPYRDRHYALLTACYDRYLDPGCIGCAAGELRPELRGRPAVRFPWTARQSWGGRFVTLPAKYDPPVERTWALAVEPSGVRLTEGTVTLGGMPAAALRAHLLDHPATRSADLLARVGIPLRGGSARASGLDAPGTPLRVIIEDAALATAPIARGPGFATLHPDALAPAPILDLAATPARRSPVQLDPVHGFTHRLRIALPPDLRPIEVPPPSRVQTRYGVWRFEVALTPDGLAIDESLTLAAHEVPVDEWPALRAFLATAQADRSRPIALRAAR